MCHAQVGKKTEGDTIDVHPDRKEGVATATFDLEEIRWQRARCAQLLHCCFLPAYMLHAALVLLPGMQPCNLVSAAGDSSATGGPTCMARC